MPSSVSNTAGEEKTSTPRPTSEADYVPLHEPSGRPSGTRLSPAVRFVAGVAAYAAYLAPFWALGWLPEAGSRTCWIVCTAQVVLALSLYVRLAPLTRVAATSGGGGGDRDGSTAERTAVTNTSVPPPPPARRRALSHVHRVPRPRVNPFVNRTWRVSQVERALLAVWAVTLLPFRVVGVVASLGVAYLSSRLAYIGVRDMDVYKNVPLPRWRRFIACGVSLGSRALLFAGGFWWIPTKGARASRREAPIVLANHVTFLDPVFMAYAFLASAIAAEDNLKSELVGMFCRASQVMYLDRENPNSRHVVLETLKQRCRDLTSDRTPQWPQCLVFPEGTTTNGRALISFKRGAFVPAVPVQPVLLRYNTEQFDPSWVLSGPEAGALAFRLLCEPVNLLAVTYMPVYRPNEAERADAGLFAENVRRTMARELDVHCTEHSYDDIILSREALRADLPPKLTTMVEMAALRAGLPDGDRISVNTVVQQVARFARFDRRKAGALTFSEFCAAFERSESPEMRNLFHLLDEDGSGQVDFREYVIGLGLLQKPPTEFDEARDSAVMKLAFRMYDLDGDGFVEAADLQRVVAGFFPDLKAPEIAALIARSSTAADGSHRISYDDFVRFALSDSRFTEEFARTFMIEHEEALPVKESRRPKKKE